MSMKKIACTFLSLAMMASAAVYVNAANTIDAYEGTINYSGINATAVDGSLAGEVISGGVGYEAVSAAFDGDMTTQASFDSNYGTDVSNWMGMKTEVAVVPTMFRLAASSAGQQSKIMNSYIQASNDGVNWTTLKHFNDWRDYATPGEGGTWAEGTYKEVGVSTTTAYQYFRYFNYNDDGANRLTEFQVFGLVPTANTVDKYEGEINYSGVYAVAVDGSLAGEVISGGVGYDAVSAAFDGDMTTQASFDANYGTDVSNWMGMKAEAAVVPTVFRLAASSVGQQSKIMNSYIQASNDGINWTTLKHFNDWRDYATPGEGGTWAEGTYKVVEVSTETAYQYFRYFNYNDDGANRLTEFQVFGPDGILNNSLSSYIGDIVVTDTKSTSVDGSLVGTVIGGGAAAEAIVGAFDGDTTTSADVTANSGEDVSYWFGLKFDCAVVPSTIKVAVNGAHHQIFNGYIQASNDGIHWTTLKDFTNWREYATPAEGGYWAAEDTYKVVSLTGDTAYTYFRYFKYNDSGNKLAEFQVLGTQNHGETAVEGAFDATTEADGYTGDTVCTVCGAVIEQGEVIPQLAVATIDKYTGEIVYTGVYATSVDGSAAGEIIGTVAEVTAAFDGDTTTKTVLGDNFDGVVANWFGLYFADGIVPASVRVAMEPHYQIFKGYIQASNDGINWITLKDFESWKEYATPAEGGYWAADATYREIDLTTAESYKYFRYFKYNDGGNQLAEFQVFELPTNNLNTYEGQIVYTGVNSTSIEGSLVGEIIGAGAEASVLVNAFDADTSTITEMSSNTNDVVEYWFGLKLAEAVVPTAIRVAIEPHHNIYQGYIQGSNDGINWTTIKDFTDWREYATPGEGGYWAAADTYRTVTLDTTTAYQYYRYFKYNDSSNRLSEFQVFGPDGILNNDIDSYIGEIVVTETKSTSVDGSLVGTVIGGGAAADALAGAFDGDVTTVTELTANSTEVPYWFGLKYDCPVVPTSIRVAVNGAHHQIYMGYVQASTDGIHWTTFGDFTNWREYATPAEGGYWAAEDTYKVVTVDTDTAYTYFRYFKYNDSGNALSEFQVFGTQAHGETEIQNKVDATTEAPGYTGDTVCTVCGAVVAKGEEIPQLAVATIDKYTGEIVYTGVYATPVDGSAAGEVIGAGAAAEALTAAFDGDTTTVTELEANFNDVVGNWFGLYFEEGIVPASIRVAIEPHHNIYQGYLQVSNDGINWTTIRDFTNWREYATPAEGGYWAADATYKVVDLTTAESYKYFRYFKYNDSGNRLSEFQVFELPENNLNTYEGEIVYTGVNSTSVEGALVGEIIVAGGEASAVTGIFDGNTTTGGGLGDNTNDVVDKWFGLYFEEAVAPSVIRVATVGAHHQIYQGYIQASNDGVNWTTLKDFTDWREYATPAEGGNWAADATYKLVELNSAAAYNYFRYFKYNDGGNQLAEFQVFGPDGILNNSIGSYIGEIVVTETKSTSVDGSLVGTVIGGGAAADALTNAFDGDTATVTELTANSGEEVLYWFGLKYDCAVVPTSIRVAMNPHYQIFHGYIQASNDGIHWTTLKDFENWRDYATPGEGGYWAADATYRVIDLTGDTAYTYFRYFKLNDSGNMLAEFQVFGTQNHTGEIVVEGAVDATTEAPGYTGDKVCDACGAIVEKGVEIPKIPVLVNEGTCGDNLTWAYYDNGALVIDGEGAMGNYDYSVTLATAAPWASFRTQVKSVTVGADVTTIGDFAFYKMTSLETVEFAEGAAIEYIGECAIGYTNIKAITIPAKNIEIAAKAFYFNAALETVAFEEGSVLASIGNYAFRNCGALANLYIPETVGYMGTNILYASTQATLSVADGSYAEKYAEAYGYNYTVRTSEEVIASGACGENANWVLSNTGVLTITGEGAIADYNFSTLAADAAPWAKMRADVVKVVIGKDITAIGSYAFYNMANLAEVEFAEDSALTSIGLGAFGYTKALKEITLPAAVEEIGKNAFYFSALESITISADSALTTIGHYAFRNTNLTAISIPATVTSIGGVILYSTNATMYVVEGSVAHTYAQNVGYDFVVLG